MNVSWKGFQRFDRSVHICSFGIVVIIDTADGGHVLQSMLNCLELLDRPADVFRFDSHERPCANSSEDVLEIVCTFQGDFGHQHDFALAPSIPEADPAILHGCALLYLLLAAEPANVRSDALCKSNAVWIVCIQHGKIIRLLVFENAGFCPCVSRERAVAIQVVGSDVEDHRHLRAECLYGLELKAGNLQDDDVVWFRSLDQRNRRSADIPANQGRQSASRQDLTGKRGGGGFAIGAGNGNDPPRQKLSRQFDLANDGLARYASLHRQRVHGDAWADHDQVLAVESTLAMFTGFNRDAVVEQYRDFIPKLVFGLRIRNRNSRAPQLQKQRRRHAGFAQSHDQHAFAS